MTKEQHENKAFNANREQKEQENQREEKDQRGGNHNPEGANQYTVGRHDDRGRKDLEEAQAQDRQDDQNENN